MSKQATPFLYYLFLQIYCCADLKSSIFEKKELQKNRTAILLKLEKNGVNKPLHSNDIEKQIRHKRNSLELSDESNVFDMTGTFGSNLLNSNLNFFLADDQLFSITVQGRNFNTSLTDSYLDSFHNYNYTYVIPLSKYMPDEYLNLMFRFVPFILYLVSFCIHFLLFYFIMISSQFSFHFLHLNSTVVVDFQNWIELYSRNFFNVMFFLVIWISFPRSNQPNIKEVEHCYNDFKKNDCSYQNSEFFNEETVTKHRINENNSDRQINTQSIVFEVAVLDFQTKMMTYRAPLQQSQVNYFVVI